MRWEKKGLIYKPSGKNYWDHYYGILPTPFLVNEDVLRIYFAATDKERFGRISFVEVSTSDPSYLLKKASDPILIPGDPGSFDDCGCNPSCLLSVGSKIFFYYSGFQRSFQVPYTIFTGLCISNDMGNSFQKYKKTPILERTDEELTIRSAPSILWHDNRFLMWYVSASGWVKMESGIFKNKMMPKYVIKKATSLNGIDWVVAPGQAISYENEAEFGFGRPWVIFDNIFKMWYSIRRVDKTYRIGYAESTDGVIWQRKDDEVGIDVSESGWDSEMICYPSVIKVKNRTFLFYNGNNNGETGFGWAELISQ